MSNELRFATPLVLSTDLILELLSVGYTRFQGEDTFENESIESFLLESFPNIFNKGNVRGQIKLMFSKEPLKNRRTQKVERQLFSWGVTQEVVEEPIKMSFSHKNEEMSSEEIIIPEPTEEIPAEFNIQEQEEVDVVIQEEKSDVLTEEVIDDSEDMTEEEVQREEELELTPWELMG